MSVNEHQTWPVSAWCAGTLKSYDRANGVGLIAPDDGGVYVVISEWLLEQNRLRPEVQRLAYRYIETPLGCRAVAAKRKENR
jgi:cold shock CspA family protein